MGLHPLLCPSDGSRIFTARWPILLLGRMSGVQQGRRGDRRGDANASSHTDAAASSVADRSSPLSSSQDFDLKSLEPHRVIARRPVRSGRGRQRGCYGGGSRQATGAGVPHDECHYGQATRWPGSSIPPFPRAALVVERSIKRSSNNTCDLRRRVQAHWTIG